jgi:hypothetical protein
MALKKHIVILKHAGLVAGCTFILSGNAHAYVDPGTGSMALQFIIGGLVAASFMLKTYYYSIKNKIASLMGRPTHTPLDSGRNVHTDGVSEEKDNS